MPHGTLRLFFFLPLCAAWAVIAPADVLAQDAQPADYRSRNFLVHTDLDKEKAEDLLKRLETMLGIISRYWGAPNRKRIEIFVVDDLKNWPARQFDPKVQPSLTNGAGITLAAGVRSGRRFNMDAVAYANSRRGTPQHEAVHAYCFQTFSTCGPTWYSEGMAEMGNYWIEGQTTVSCPPYIVRYLTTAFPKTVRDITSDTQGTGDGWQNYAWRWALCHMLAYNSNYSDRFRPLGLALLTQKPGASFKRVYGTRMKELEFEYRYFLKNLAVGLDVDRIRWDFKTRFRPLTASRTSVSKIRADRGWQASRVRVVKGQKYTLEAEGTWRLSKDGDELSADGNENRDGKLIGVILEADYGLSKPIDIGATSEITAETDGRLFLRCRESLVGLNDNEGSVKVRIKMAKSSEQPKPTK